MTILFTMTPTFNPNAGGVQRTTWKLGKYFREQGLEVVYYSLANEGHAAVEYGTLFSAPKPGKNSNTANILDLRTVIQQIKPDVVINQMPYERELREALLAEKKNLGYLLLGCLRNSLFNFKNNARDRIKQLLPHPLASIMDNRVGEAVVQWRHKRKHSQEIRAIIDDHDYFILLAPPNRQELEYFVGHYKPEKVTAISNSIPEVLPEVPQKEKIILHVGRLNIPQKRSDLLLPFWEQVFPQLPDWEFVVVGAGPYYQQLKQDIDDRQIPRISLEGYQSPEPYYKKSAIFMMPSAYEGFPNTLLEAQSYGCAPLAFDNYAALSWIVNNGVNAHLIPPFDVSSMGKKVIELATNEITLHSTQEEALKNAERFTIDQVGRQWLDFFETHGNL